MKRKVMLVAGAVLLVVIVASLAFRLRAKSGDKGKPDPWQVTFTLPASATNPPAKPK